MTPGMTPGDRFHWGASQSAARRYPQSDGNAVCRDGGHEDSGPHAGNDARNDPGRLNPKRGDSRDDPGRDDSGWNDAGRDDARVDPDAGASWGGDDDAGERRSD